MNRIQTLLIAMCLAWTAADVAQAQRASYIDQEAVADLLNLRFESLEAVPEVHYEYYVLENDRGNSALARNDLYRYIGEGDVHLGKTRAELVQMINRRLMQTYSVGDTVIVPTQFNLDFRAYTPFPRYYTGGREFDKLFIMDKTIQAFAAYEYGQLMRWGIINTGNPDEKPTPNGRYNFNWQQEERISTDSPPGEEWLMYWVMNFHADRGMHVHQYEMPTGGPMSHGCVRLVDADAEWVYHWADTWTTTSSSVGIASVGARILKQGTTVLVIGTEPRGKPRPFSHGRRYPVINTVDLPAHPYDVPPGTPQQKRFDELRSAG
ncbi:MAG: L,D-transpeptidase [Bacteroidota bacterium]|nr:L,D-transpeptidase [Bacteroidota bacterium]MDE2835377.1 L,D-transpeptidase [Bacteroidota bacterium]MDE2957823.1 L,D-transpeptidase [Bacteroidota bacterium]